MDYSIEKLQTAADCNSLQALVNKEKSDLEYKKLTLERSHSNYSERSTRISSDLALTTTEISALATILETLPEGNAKEEASVKKTKAEYHLFTLNEQSDQYGVVPLLEKEMEITLIEKQLAEMDVFYQAVEDKKNTLAA
jgi:hypothetical protein